jgi:hypothetical protein
MFTVHGQLYFLEVDRNTEPNVSVQKKKTVKSTIEKYIQAYRGRHHTKAYGAQNFRVLFVTKSEPHISNIITIINSLHFPEELFYFTTYKAIHSKFTG